MTLCNFYIEVYFYVLRSLEVTTICFLGILTDFAVFYFKISMSVYNHSISHKNINCLSQNVL